MTSTTAQRDHISTNYSFVARDLADRGINVILQAVARGEVEGKDCLSLSSNPDLTVDLLGAMSKRSTEPLVVVGQVNAELPFMYGEAALPADTFDILVEDDSLSHRLFAVPRSPVSDADFMIGLYASTLVRDGGTLQIGIGSLGDALAYALCLRHQDNARYREALSRLGVVERFGHVIERLGGTAPFSQGLFAASEMLSDGLVELLKAGVVKRRVYDDVTVQRLLDEGQIDERVTPQTLNVLCETLALHGRLEAGDVARLRRLGVLRADVGHDGQVLILADGTRLAPDLRDEATRSAIERQALGERLLGGCCVHAGFFVGSDALYRYLRELPASERARIHMRPISWINRLDDDVPLARRQRREARFFNTALKVSLLGGATSDTLEGGRVVGGVGGQYNFVAMAHELHDARSVLQVRSVRESGGRTTSNLVWNDGHATIPRHLRDLVVTEYGIADLRGHTDRAVIERLLAICDGRFQASLEAEAVSTGKLPERREQGAAAVRADNRPETFARTLATLRKQQGLFPRYPFGSEQTSVEQVLFRALQSLEARTGSARGKLAVGIDAVLHGGTDARVRPYLARMGLADGDDPGTRFARRLVSSSVRRVLDEDA